MKHRLVIRVPMLTACRARRSRGAMAGWTVMVLWLGSTLLTLAATTPDLGFVPGQLLVQPRAGVAEADFETTIQAHGARQKLHLHQINVRVLELSEDTASQVLERLQRHPHIAFAERDYLARLAFAPNDPYVVSGEAWHLSKIEAPLAWDVTTGRTNIVIAILDSGVNFAHPDLADQLLQGYDFANGDANPTDDFGHGTAVAGVAAASGNNGIGVAGVAFNCRLLPVKVSDATGYASYSKIAQGINYAADQGARVINLSITGTFSSSTLQDAVNYAWGKGAVLVAAAGNSGDSTPMYPAACQNVLAVSATEADDSLCSFSSYGDHIALAAPGNVIWTTTRDLGYGTWWGTSLAGSIVAGVAALVATANPSLSNTQIVSLLKQSADDLGAAGFDQYFGYGRVNARRAVLTATPPPPPQMLGLSAAAGGDVTVNWNAVSGRTYRVQFKNALSESNWTSLTPDVVATGATCSFVDRPNGAAQRFYRVVLLP